MSFKRLPAFLPKGTKIMPKKRVAKQTKQWVNRKLEAVKEDLTDSTIVTSEAAGYDTPSVNLITSPTTSAGDLRFKGMIIRGQVANGASAGTVFVRIALVQSFLKSDDDPVTNIPGLSGADSFYDTIVQTPSNMQRVFFEKIISLGEATSVEGNEKKLFKIKVTEKMLPRKVIRNFGSNMLNGIWLVAVSNVLAATSPTIEYKVIMAYSEKRFETVPRSSQPLLDV